MFGCFGGTFVLDQSLHFLCQALVPAGDVHVERVVAAAPPVSNVPPLVVRRQQAGAWLWQHMVDCRGEARGGGGEGRRRGGGLEWGHTAQRRSEFGCHLECLQSEHWGEDSSWSLREPNMPSDCSCSISMTSYFRTGARTSSHGHTLMNAPLCQTSEKAHREIAALPWQKRSPHRMSHLTTECCYMGIFNASNTVLQH